MPVVTEVMDTRQVALVEKWADMFQVGARNMQNFDLLKEIGLTRKPVLLKRGMSATVKDPAMHGPEHVGRTWSVDVMSYLRFEGERVCYEADFHDKGSRARSLGIT